MVHTNTQSMCNSNRDRREGKDGARERDKTGRKKNTQTKAGGKAEKCQARERRKKPEKKDDGKQKVKVGVNKKETHQSES